MISSEKSSRFSGSSLSRMALRGAAAHRFARRRPRFGRPMDLSNRVRQIRPQSLKIHCKSFGFRHDDIITAGASRKVRRQPQSFPQAAFDAVSLDGAADTLCHSDAEPRRSRRLNRLCRSCGSHLCQNGRLQGKGTGMVPLALRRPQKIRPPRQPWYRLGFSGNLAVDGIGKLPHLPFCPSEKRVPIRAAGTRCSSGRQTLAAARTPRRNHFAAADRRHTSPKTVPALANELARLVSTFHLNAPCRKTRPAPGRIRRVCFCFKPEPAAQDQAEICRLETGCLMGQDRPQVNEGLCGKVSGSVMLGG